MDAAIYGLLGTLAGGLITVVVALIAFWKEYSLWKAKFKSETSIVERDSKFERYAMFLGAYYRVEGMILDMVDILSWPEDKVPGRLSSVLKDQDFQQATKDLNIEKGWIALLARGENVLQEIGELEKAHGKALEIISQTRSGQLTPSEALAKIAPISKDMQSISEKMRRTLQNDAQSKSV